MLRDTGFRKLKIFFVGMLNKSDDEATTAADKYNEWARVYGSTPKNYIVDIDIRDPSLHELSLARNKRWWTVSVVKMYVRSVDWWLMGILIVWEPTESPKVISNIMYM